MQLQLPLRFIFNPPQVCMHIKNVFIFLFSCNDRRKMLVVVIVAAVVYPHQFEIENKYAYCANTLAIFNKYATMRIYLFVSNFNGANKVSDSMLSSIK